MVVVPDASVILKWVLQRGTEPDSDVALALLEAYVESAIDIRLPTLWRYEVGNVLGIKEPDLAREAMEALLTYQFPEAALERGYCLDVLRLMRELRGASFYDVSYHVLAMRTSGVYVTADRDYVERAGRRKDVVLLASWTPPGSRARSR
jgi:predicted nucleic acid-binding protein